MIVAVASTLRIVTPVLLALLAAGCDIGTRPSAVIIPGPAVPNPLPTATPYVWDTRDELAVWIENAVSRGSFSLEGSGAGGFIRIDRPEREWVLRGPDLAPAATGVRTFRLRYRWRPDPSLSPTAARTIRTEARLETTSPLPDYLNGQAMTSATLEPQTDWTDVTFTSGQITAPLDVLYGYLHSYGANRGVLDIDRLELVR
jgi:hypothetical protein